jgi:competence protein ComEC
MSARHALGPALALSGLVVGILLGEHVGPRTAAPELCLGVIALVAAWFCTGAARMAVAVIALALVGIAVTERALDGQHAHDLAAAVRAHETVRVRGSLITDPDGPRFGASALVRVGGAGRIVLAKATGDGAGRLRILEAGDRVALEGRLEPIPSSGFDARARWNHAVAVLTDVRVIAFAPATSPLFRVANTARGIVLRGMVSLPPDERALLAGFLLGDTRGVPDAVIADYRAAGLSHLLAVSGANVAFVLVVFSPVLRRLTLVPRTGVALAIVVAFAAATRFEPSVLRASALTAVTVLATFAGRAVAPARALCIAIIVLLVVDPFLLHSVGFHLSCAASGGIALLAPMLSRRLPGPALLREPLAVSIAAQLGVTPVLLVVFGNVPVVSPLANLLAYPAAEALGVFGLAASVVGGILPPVAVAVAPVLDALLAWVTLVAHAAASVGISADVRATLLLGLVSSGVFITRASSRRHREATELAVADGNDHARAG